MTNNNNNPKYKHIDSDFCDITNMNEWDERNVISHFQKYINGFNDEDAILIKKNRINGLSLLNLKENNLKDAGFAIGLSTSIFAEIQRMKRLRKALRKKQKQKNTFSSYRKLEDVLNKYGITISDISSLPAFNIGRMELVDENIFESCIEEIKRRLRCMGTAHTSNEAARREYISAILFTAANYFKNISISPEFEIEGNEITGRVDYAIKKIINSTEEDLICITEGKQSDLKRGIGQNILQLESAIQVNEIFLFEFFLKSCSNKFE